VRSMDERRLENLGPPEVVSQGGGKRLVAHDGAIR
jgi:hypothetical protein